MMSVFRQWFAPSVLLAVAVGLVLSQIKEPSYLLELWRPSAEMGILACAMTAIMLTGGIDLSVGAIAVLASMTLGVAHHRGGWPIGAAAAAAVGVATLAGAINGGLVTLGVAPLVVTLATMTFFGGLAMAISGGQRLADLPSAFCQLGQASWLGVPTQVYAFLIIAAATGVLVHATRWGRYLYAIGDNRQAAVFAAVPVRQLEGFLYAGSGLLAGVFAVFYTARNAAAVPDPIAGLELQVISCVILGGTRVTGGFGGIGRTVIGVAILTHLERGLRLLSSHEWEWFGRAWKFETDARLIAIGLAVIAVAIWNERIAARRLAS